jgi:hypothetical protein
MGAILQGAFEARQEVEEVLVAPLQAVLRVFLGVIFPPLDPVDGVGDDLLGEVFDRAARVEVVTDALSGDSVLGDVQLPRVQLLHEDAVLGRCEAGGCRSGLRRWCVRHLGLRAAGALLAGAVECATIVVAGRLEAVVSSLAEERLDRPSQGGAGSGLL